jgi:hypothetical protein
MYAKLHNMYVFEYTKSKYKTLFYKHLKQAVIYVCFRIHNSLATSNQKQ